MSDLVLVAAVVIHSPDFFVPAAPADVVDLRFRDTVHAAAEAKDDLVGEFVRDQPRVRFRRLFLVLLPQYDR